MGTKRILSPYFAVICNKVIVVICYLPDSLFLSSSSNVCLQVKEGGKDWEEQ